MMITYDFPPIGGGGIQRNVKFLKYLSRLGWDTNVLTVREREYYVYDYSLLDEISHTTIFKSKSADPVALTSTIKKMLGSSNKKNTALQQKKSKIDESAWYVDLYRNIRDWTMFPDGYSGWIPFAYRKGIDVVKHKRPDILFATFPYATNALVTYYLSKKFNIPFVIDFRDPWLDDMYVNFPSIMHKKLHGFYEKKITHAASKIIVFGDSYKETLQKKYPSLQGKIEVITNGYDPEDFENLQPYKKNEKIRIVYSGAVYVDRRETYQNFLKALTELSDTERNNFEIIFVGDKLEWAIELVKKYKLSHIISFTGYKDHKEALNYLSSADVSLMFLKKDDRYALTGKIFEYLGLNLPIMACVEPDGACAKMLATLHHDQGVAAPDSVSDMVEVLRKILNNKLPKLKSEYAKFYSRKYHSHRLSEILNDILND